MLYTIFLEKTFNTLLSVRLKTCKHIALTDFIVARQVLRFNKIKRDEINKNNNKIKRDETAFRQIN